jgi:hypothetical protein
MADEPRERKEEALNRQLREANLALQKKLGRSETLLDTYRLGASIFLAVVVFAAVLLSFYPRTLFYAQNVFNPTKIPQDYVTVNKYITAHGGDARIMWMPFISPSHMYYDWEPEKRLSPFNVWSSNPSLNNMQEAYNPDSYFVWLSDLLQTTQQFSAEQLMNKDLTLPHDIASRLFIPFAARYMIFDSSIMGYKFEDYFERDGSLASIFHTPVLTVYQPDYYTPLIRVADKTVKANSFYDNLAISAKFPASQLGRIAFVDQKPVTASFASVGHRYGLLDINDYTQYERINGGFENGEGNRSSFLWFADNNPPYLTLSQDPTHRTGGIVSLMAVNRSAKQYDIGWVKGATVPVQEGQVFTFQTNVRTRNAVWTNATLEGYRDDTKQWVQLLQCPSIAASNSGWNKYRCSICIPRGITSIRPALAAGWAQDKSKGPAVSWFDDVRIGRVEDRFYSDLFAPVASPEVSFKKVSGEKYLVHVKNATGPFLLVFGEAFDPFWVATTSDGKQVQPAPLYSTINGYQMDKTGEYDLTITYQPQAWYTSGRLIAVAVVVLCLAFLVYDWRLRDKGKVVPFLKRVLGGARKAGARLVEVIKGPPREGRY